MRKLNSVRLFIGIIAYSLNVQVSLAQDRAAFGTVTSYSLSMGTLDGYNTGGYYFQMYFSTPDGITNAWPQGIGNWTLSYELMPSSPGSGTYNTDFAIYDTTHGYYYNRGTMSVYLPTTDTDGNGCPDALQVNKSFNSIGTASTTEYASPDGGYTWVYYGTRSYDFSFSRNAGSALGTFNGSGYDPTSRTTSAFGGGFRVDGGTGAAVYNPNSRSITFGGNSFSFNTSGSGTSTYTRISDNQISVAQFNFVTSDGYTRTIKPFTLNRSGNYYRGYPIELVDGNPGTSYIDFKYCHVEIYDSNDSDADGIPDLSDGSAPLLSQSITFNSLASKTYGDASFPLSSSSSSGLGVSYSSSDTGVATISGNTVTIVGAGTTTITASQSGNSQYSPAPNVQQTLTVNKKTLLITADNKSKEAGQSDPLLTYTTSGLLSGSSITGALSRSTGESVGTYNINQGTITAGNNYAISFTQGSFVITAVAPQLAIITTTPPPSLVYDAANKPFGVSVTPPASVQGEYIQLASIGNPSSGYGLTYNLSPSGFLTTAYSGIDGIFRASQASTKISSTGLTYSFPSSLVSSTAGGENARNPWQNTTAATGGPTSQISSYFSPLGVTWSSSSLYAVPSCGITFDLSKIKPSNKTITKFTTYYGMHSGNSTGDVAYAILLDGVLVSSGRNYTSANPFSNLIEVDIAPSNKFLTLVACDNGDDYYWDHSVFVDPKVYAKTGELSANCIYTGINGTVYGPSSVAPKDVGYYRLEVSSNDPNYIGTKTQEFTITPKSATVTAAAKTKVYGSADPTLTYTSSGLIGSDSLSGALTRAVGENVGSYNILVGTLSAGANYTLSYLGESLVITGNYSSWASSCGLTGNNALQNADPDNDGKNNAAEYAFGGNPSNSDQQIVSASLVPGGIKYVWLERKVQGQVTYNPKTSTDLALSYSSWATVNSAESNPQPVGISTDYKQMEVVLPTSVGKGFLKIEANVQ